MKKDTETNQCESTIYIDRQTDGHRQTDRKIERQTERHKKIIFQFLHFTYVYKYLLPK